MITHTRQSIQMLFTKLYHKRGFELKMKNKLSLEQTKELTFLGGCTLIGLFIQKELKLNNLHVMVIPCILIILGIIGLTIIKRFSTKGVNPNRRSLIKLFVVVSFKTLVDLIKLLKNDRIKGFIKSKFFILYAILQVTNIVLVNTHDFKLMFWELWFIALTIIIICKFIYLLETLSSYQKRLDYYFNYKVFLKSWKPDKVVLRSRQYLTDKDYHILEMVFESTIVNLQQNNYTKTIFVLHLQKGLSKNYTKMGKGTNDRLKQILIDMRFKPNYVKTINHDNSRVVVFTLNVNPKKLINSTQEIESKLGLCNGNLTITTNQGLFYFEISSNLTNIYLLSDAITNVKIKNESLPFLVGINPKNSNPVIKDIVEVNHLLIAGKSNSGKSTTLKSIIESIMYLNSNKVFFYMLDFGESALTRYSNFVNVKYIETYDDDCNQRLDNITNAVNELHNLLIKRKLLFKQVKVEKLSEYNNLTKSNLPYIIFTMDEANEFKSFMGIKDDQADIVRKINTIFKQGRKYGVYNIFAVQKTNDKEYFKCWKGETTRLAHHLTDRVDVENATGSSDLNNLVPNLKKGEFILDIKDNRNEPEILKAALTDNENSKLYDILERGFVTNETTNAVIKLNKNIN